MKQQTFLCKAVLYTDSAHLFMKLNASISYELYNLQLHYNFISTKIDIYFIYSIPFIPTEAILMIKGRRSLVWTCWTGATCLCGVCLFSICLHVFLLSRGMCGWLIVNWPYRCKCNVMDACLSLCVSFAVAWRPADLFTEQPLDLLVTCVPARSPTPLSAGFLSVQRARL